MPTAKPPRVPSEKSLVYRTETTISATAATIWGLLAELPDYQAWNPWIVEAHGDLTPGGVVWSIVVLGKKKMRVKHVVLAVDPEKRLCWRDAGWNSLLVYGQRTRTLDPLPDGTVKVSQELLIEGPLRGLVARMYGSALEAGLEAESSALKSRAESR